MSHWCGNFTEYAWRRLRDAGMLANTAVESPDGNVTFEELFGNVNRASNLLRAQGVGPGDRIALVMRDSVYCVYAFLGAIRIGAIPVALNTQLPANEYPFFVSDSQARLVIADEDLAPKIAGTGSECPAMLATGELARLMAQQPAKAEFHRCEPDDPAFWQYSSGSSGRGKAIVHKHVGPIEIYERYAKEILNIKPSDKVLCVSRMFFGYGLGNSLLYPLQAGATSVLFPGPIEPEAIGAAINKYRPTLFFSVPSFYKRLLDCPSTSFNASSIRLAISAGESLPSSVYYDWMERTGVELLDGIGSTEALHIFVSARAGEVHPGSCGRPLAGVDVKLAEESEDAAGCKLGRLLVRHPGIALGYWNDAESTDRVFRDGWLDTGDIFRVDRSGYYWHMGRADDMFKVKGMWVSPVEVEDALLRHEMVRDCAVIGAPNKHGLTEPVAFVVSHDSAASHRLAEHLSQHCEDLLARYKSPTKYTFIDSIPRTATGKKKRYEFRNRGSSDRGASEA